MSFLSNKMASLLGTFVVLAIVLFCSSSAEAHANHEADIPPVFELAVADEIVTGGITVSDVEENDAKHLAVSSSTCCGTGASTCSAATADIDAVCFRMPPEALRLQILGVGLLDGVILDGLIKPPKALV